MHAQEGTVVGRYFPLVLLPLALLLAAACSLGATGPPRTATNVGATQTRNVETGQLATARALADATPTPQLAATQTRTAELAQLATLTAPSPTPDRAAAAASLVTLVGQVAGSEALVGVITDGAQATLYFCDGSSLARWFRGRIAGNRLEVATPDGAVVTAEIPRGTKEVTGTLTLPSGTALAFSSLPTTSLDNAGLYRATGQALGEAFTMGVIVLPDGRFAGVLQQGQTLHAVTDPQFGPSGLTARVAGLPGSFTASRMAAP